MNKKHFRLEGRAYTGNHPDGKNTIEINELPELAEAVGVTVNALLENIFGYGAPERGMRYRVNGHIIEVTRVVTGVSDGFERHFKYTFTIVK